MDRINELTKQLTDATKGIMEALPIIGMHMDQNNVLKIQLGSEEFKEAFSVYNATRRDCEKYPTSLSRNINGVEFVNDNLKLPHLNN